MENADAMAYLGLCYEKGFGLEKNNKKAFEYYQKASDLGNESSMLFLGNALILAKDENETNWTEGLQWIQKAAEQGSVASMKLLGDLFKMTGEFETSIEWYEKATEEGSIEAMSQLQFNYEHGLCTDKDEKAAMKWLRKAAEAGDVDSMLKLGKCYERGENGLEEDKLTAFQLYQEAEKMGSVKAQSCLGACYTFGWGVEQDDEIGIRWYITAANNGSDEAMWHLGYGYKTGQFGLEKDLAEARRWYEKYTSAEDTGFVEMIKDEIAELDELGS